MTPDLVALGGKVLTMDPARTVAAAFAVKDGRILATGTTEEIAAMAGPDTERLDLAGRTVTPGLIDTHIHVVSLGSIGAGAGLGFIGTGSTLDISDAATLDEVLERIAARARETPEGKWVVTGWPKALPPEVMPTRWDLDRVAPDVPVFMSGYPYVVVNSLLIERAGITKDTPVPFGGEIVKDPETGEPNGVLAFQAVYQLLPDPPQPSVEETERAIRQVHDAFLAEGLTAYKDVGIRNNAIRAYQNLRMRGELRVRTQWMWTWVWSEAQAAYAAERFTPYGDDWLMMRSVKISLDGGIESRTAWSYEDWYRNHTERVPGSRGYPKIAPEELDRMVDVLHRSGLQVCCHCEGERAIDTFLSAVEKALETTPATGCRHSVIHCTLPTDEANRKMAAMGDNICVEAQAPWLAIPKWAGGAGPERSPRFNPFRTWLDLGITVGNGCDFPPEPYPPRIGLWAASTRYVEDGRYGHFPYGTDECLTFEEALATYTIDAAKCLKWEDIVGSLEAGKYADFVIWREDIATMPVMELRDATVDATAVEGRIAYRRGEDRAAA